MMARLETQTLLLLSSLLWRVHASRQYRRTFSCRLFAGWLCCLVLFGTIALSLRAIFGWITCFTGMKGTPSSSHRPVFTCVSLTVSLSIVELLSHLLLLCCIVGVRKPHRRVGGGTTEYCCIRVITSSCLSNHTYLYPYVRQQKHFRARITAFQLLYQLRRE